MKKFMIAARQDALTTNKRGVAKTLKGENLLNWELARQIFSTLDPPHTRCVTYELPLSAVTRGQLKADVVVFNASGLIEIVELKQSGRSKNSDSPLMALVEAICYTLQMLRCWSGLRAELANWVELGQPPHTINIVLAGPGYWDNCHGSGIPIANDEVDALDKIVQRVGHVLQNQHIVPRAGVVLTLANVVQGRLFRSRLTPAGPPILDSIISDRQTTPV